MKFRMLLLIGALFTSCIPKAAGLSYSPEAFLSWEEVVANSDFVGIIACVRAGAHVSEFVVVDSWKGTIEQPRFRIHSSSRVGNRMLACLVPQRPEGTPYRDQVSSLMQPIGGMEAYLELWPEAAAEFRPADSISISIFPMDPVPGREAGGTSRYSQGTVTPFDTLESRARVLLKTSGEAREALLIASALRHLLENPGRFERAFQVPEANGTTRNVHDLNDLLAVLLDPETEIDRQRIAWALGRAGGEGTLARLEAWNFEVEEDRTWLADVIEKLKRYASNRKRAYTPWKPEPMGDDLSIQDAKRALKRVPENRKDFTWDLMEPWCNAFEVMTVRKPYYLAKYLHDFDPVVSYSEMAGQNLAVWYATRIREDRVRCLKTLATAEHPGIALAGAAYLLHEDPALGVGALEAWANTDSPLRRQAAELLVAYGKKEFVPIMLESATTTTTRPITWGSHQAALATLSNAAHHADVPQPPQAGYPIEEYQTSLRTWWEAYGKNMTLNSLPVQWPPPAE